VEDQVTAVLEQIGSLLREAGETHHRVFRIVDGADDDWASWYADWLINLSELPALLGVKPVRSELTYLLVSLDKEYTATQPGEPWERYTRRRSSATSARRDAEPTRRSQPRPVTREVLAWFCGKVHGIRLVDSFAGLRADRPTTTGQGRR
jgi:hypothetical protein